MDNGQWVVFQKRKNGEVNFNRGWADYVAGFGDPEWEYWLGLQRIHCLTAAVFRAELRVDLGDFEGNNAMHAVHIDHSVSIKDAFYIISLGTLVC